MRPGLLLAVMVGALAAVPAAAASKLAPEAVRSPDGRNSISLTLDAEGRPTYSVSRNGVCIGLVLPNIVSMALAAVPEQDVGKASGVLNTARQVGAVVGVAVGVAVFQGVGGPGPFQRSSRPPGRRAEAADRPCTPRL